jgi:hypothetical protein
MTFSILALVSARNSHINPDSEAGGLIPGRYGKFHVFTPEFNFWYLRSGLKENMSKYKERW